MTDALYWLVLAALVTAFMGFPYVLERISRVGLFAPRGSSMVLAVATRKGSTS